MIKFETINGVLCRMVEPEPLTKNAWFPCVVQLIQDDSPMGGYNRTMETSHLLAHIEIINGLDAIHFVRWQGSKTHYSRFEIIGYPVADGSLEWALYQMMQGHKIINSNGTIPFCHHEDRILRCGDDISWDIDHWLRIYDDTRGWQLYEPQPEPAKEQFAVGDWVEIEVSGVLSQQQATSGAFADSIKCGGVEFYANGNPVMQPLNARIIRKLDPSEVIVNIGCLRGTVTYAVSNDCFLLAKVYDPQHRACCIDMSMLDPATASMVKELLAKQKEEM